MNRVRLWWFAAGISLAGALVVLFALIGPSSFPITPKWERYSARRLANFKGDLDAARARWEAGRIPHYHLLIESSQVSYPSETACQREIEVREEQVIGLEESVPDCGDMQRIPAQTASGETISGLFGQLENDMSQIRWSVAGVGCDYLWIDVTYDSQLGYPTKIQYTWPSPPQSWAVPGYSGCLTIYIPDGPEIAITLTPLS